jgi:hypothetical protein
VGSHRNLRKGEVIIKSIQILIAITLFGAAPFALAKDADPSSLNKPYLEMTKRDRRHAVPDVAERGLDWQPYLRWHRDATTLSGSGDGANSGLRPPSLQL